MDRNFWNELYMISAFLVVNSISVSIYALIFSMIKKGFKRYSSWKIAIGLFLLIPATIIAIVIFSFSVFFFDSWGHR